MTSPTPPATLFGDTTSLRREELFTSAMLKVVRRGAVHRPRSPAAVTAPDAARIAERARRLIDDAVLSDVTADDLAAVAGRSRFAVYRAFRTVYGMAPSDYQRQLRRRTARAMLARGESIAAVATETGFADQSHLTRWFTRHFGITPAAYRQAHEHRPRRRGLPAGSA
jgi:AraC-like DNA-binding protein